MGKSTIGDILKVSKKWLALPENEEAQSGVRHLKHDHLEYAVYMWFTDMSCQNITPPSPMKCFWKGQS